MILTYLLEADGRTPRPEPDERLWTTAMNRLREAVAAAEGGSDDA